MAPGQWVLGVLWPCVLGRSLELSTGALSSCSAAAVLRTGTGSAWCFMLRSAAQRGASCRLKRPQGQHGVWALISHGQESLEPQDGCGLVRRKLCGLRSRQMETTVSLGGQGWSWSWSPSLGSGCDPARSLPQPFLGCALPSLPGPRCPPRTAPWAPSLQGVSTSWSCMVLVRWFLVLLLIYT